MAAMAAVKAWRAVRGMLVQLTYALAALSSVGGLES
jgi:hypothetical protein